MDIEKKAHDLAMLTLKILIEEKRYTLDSNESVPNIINEISFEYNRIYDDFIKELKNQNS